MEKSFYRTIFIDIEMAGQSVSAPVIEVAAVAVESASYRIIDTIDMKIEFDMNSVKDFKSLGVNKFSAEIWSKYAIPEEAAAKKLSIFFRRHATLELKSKKSGRYYAVAQLAGHNADLFDAPRLQRLFQRHKLFFPCSLRTMCTEQKARWLVHDLQLEPPPDYKLRTLCKYLGLECLPDHTALSDALATVELAQALARLQRIAAATEAA